MSDSFTTIIEEVSFLLIKKTSRVVEGAVHYREKYIYICCGQNWNLGKFGICPDRIGIPILTGQNWNSSFD